MHMKNDGTLDVSAEQRETIKKLEQRILDLEAKLVQRDVYEAEQRLPPEQAALIKHLKTVEQCIDEGPVTYYYAEESDCSFCGEYEGHKRDCAWVELQLDRGATKVLDDIHAAALRENERRARQTRPQAISNLQRLNEAFSEAWPNQRTQPLTSEELRRMCEAIAASREQTTPVDRMRVYTNPLVAPGTVYVMNTADFQTKPPASSEVAPPTDEDVP